MAKINIIPTVLKYDDFNEKVDFSSFLIEENLSSFHKELLCKYIDNTSKNKIIFIKESKVEEGTYYINVNKDNIECIYCDEDGKHNAICTLVQLLANINILTTCRIYDKPLFKIRSVMIDVSRNKISKLETLKDIAKKLSLLKINDIQLYLEGRSFYYDFLKKHYKNKNDFLLPSELNEFRIYCESIGITLTPNCNCFGHMTYWLNQEEFKEFAYNKKGFVFEENGTNQYPQTIDPSNEKACQFIFKMFDEILKCFPNAKRMFVGGDEPFELLFPIKNEKADEIYKNYMLKIASYLHQKGIIPCIWGDVAKSCPEIFKDFKNTIFNEWGYEEDNISDKVCKIYSNNNVPFMVCPGTSCWLSFAGRMENMLNNFKDAALNGSNNNALGMVITDWNDGGSFSMLPTNLLTYAYGAMYAWAGNNYKKEDLQNYLDKNFYKMKLADSIYNLGNYYLLQNSKTYNMTKLFISFFACQTDGINIDIKNYGDCNTLLCSNDVLNYHEYNATLDYLNQWRDNFDFDKNNLYSVEIEYIYRLIMHSLKLNKLYLDISKINARKEDVVLQLKDIKLLKKEFIKLWNIRNKKSELKQTLKRFKMLEYKYDFLLKLLSI